MGAVLRRLHASMRSVYMCLLSCSESRRQKSCSCSTSVSAWTTEGSKTTLKISDRYSALPT